MNILRKLGIGLAVTVLSIALLGLAWSHVATATILKRDTVKRWLDTSGFYDRATDAVLEAASKNQTEDQKQNDLPVDDPQVQAIAKGAFSPEFLRTNIEQVLDGTYGWLEGKTDKPVFSVDLSGAKQQLADGIGNYAISRAGTLPACTSEQLQEFMAAGGDFNPLTTPCLPPGTDVQAAGARIRNEILTNDSFLNQTSYTGDDITMTENGRELTANQSTGLKNLRNSYKLASYGPYIFAGLVILSALAIIFMSSTRPAGIRRTGVIFITSGLLVGLAWLGMSRLSGWMETRAADSLSESDAGQKLGLGLIDAIFKDVGGLLQWYGIGFVALGIAGIVLSWKLGKPGAASTNNPSPTEPKPPIDDSPKTETPTETKPKAPAPKPPRKIQL